MSDPRLTVSPGPVVAGTAAGLAVPEEEPLLHTRRYTVQTFRRGPDSFRLRGEVHDEKPPGLYIDDDPDPLTVHRMAVDLVIAFPSLEITDAAVVFETHPHRICPSITERYRELIGLSIARGYNKRIKELFGGPRGCTHVTALLAAMGPVAIQTVWSMRSADGGDGPRVRRDPNASEEERRQAMAFNLNTCHVWDEDGDVAQEALRGEFSEVPLWIERRYEQLGRPVEGW